MIPTAWFFHYKYVHLVCSLLAIGSSIWQGANYYIEVFSERYHDSLEQKAQQIEEQYLFIDENLDHLLNQKWQETRDMHSDISDLDLTEGDYDTSDEYADGSNQRPHDDHSESNESNDSGASDSVESAQSGVSGGAKAFMES